MAKEVEKKTAEKVEATEPIETTLADQMLEEAIAKKKAEEARHQSVEE